MSSVLSQHQMLHQGADSDVGNGCLSYACLSPHISQYLVFRLTLFSRIMLSAGVASLRTLITFHSTTETPQLAGQQILLWSFHSIRFSVHLSSAITLNWGGRVA